jgi:nucleotide-binding universal stress UspA family protein
MLKIVIAVDGSEASLNAVRYAIKLAGLKSDVRLHVLNVQPPLPSRVSSFVSSDVVRSYHQDEGEKCLKEARALLEHRNIPSAFHIVVGPAAERIVDYAREQQCDLILMGSRGLSGLPGLLLGSVTIHVLHLSEIPVTVIPHRRPQHELRA